MANFNFARLFFMFIGQEGACLSAMILRVILYYLVIYIFYLIFDCVTQNRIGFYYICFTQMLVTAYMPTTFNIFQDLQSDLFLLRSAKPITYLTMQSFHSLATFTVRINILLIAFMLFVAVMATSRPIISVAFLYFALTSFLGAIIYNFLTIIIGLLSYWSKDVKTIFFLNLTTMFCLGGLISPLENYHPYLKKIALCTPYPWLLSYPASVAIFSQVNYNSIAMQLIWCAVLALGSYLLFHKVQIRALKY